MFVRYVGFKGRAGMSRFCPNHGTIGKIVHVKPDGFGKGWPFGGHLVIWPQSAGISSIYGDNMSWIPNDDLEFLRSPKYYIAEFLFKIITKLV